MRWVAARVVTTEPWVNQEKTTADPCGTTTKDDAALQGR